MARLVLRDLTDHGFDVFMDLEDLDSGEFEQIILAQIATRAHFVVLVEPQSLDPIADDGDWLRREAAHALRHGRNIVPLLIGGVRMPSPADLPADVARLPAFTAVPVYADYFSEAMQKLRERFLRSSDRMSRVTASAAHVDGLRPVSQRRRPGPLDRPSLSQRPRGGSP